MAPARVLTVGGDGIEIITLPVRLAGVARIGKILRGQGVDRVRVLIDATGGVITRVQSLVLAQVHVGVTGEDSLQTAKHLRGGLDPCEMLCRFAPQNDFSQVLSWQIRKGEEQSDETWTVGWRGWTARKHGPHS